jgi:hypothetical protein
MGIEVATYREALCSVLLNKYYSGDKHKGEVCSTLGVEPYTTFWWKNQKERVHMEDLVVNERIILKRIF